VETGLVMELIDTSFTILVYRRALIPVLEIHLKAIATTLPK
jgi:hypothetical protein